MDHISVYSAITEQLHSQSIQFSLPTAGPWREGTTWALQKRTSRSSPRRRPGGCGWVGEGGGSELQRLQMKQKTPRPRLLLKEAALLGNFRTGVPGVSLHLHTQRQWAWSLVVEIPVELGIRCSNTGLLNLRHWSPHIHPLITSPFLTPMLQGPGRIPADWGDPARKAHCSAGDQGKGPASDRVL